MDPTVQVEKTTVHTVITTHEKVQNNNNNNNGRHLPALTDVRRDKEVHGDHREHERDHHHHHRHGVDAAKRNSFAGSVSDSGF